GLRTLQAAIAGSNGEVVESLPPTSVVISEDSRSIVHYNVHDLPVPERIALGLYFPEGEPGDGIVAALTALKRENDRWSVVRHHAASVFPLLHQAFGSLGAISLPRHVLLYAGQPLNPGAVETELAPIVRLAHAGRVVIHSVAAPGEEDGEGCQLAQASGGVVIRADTRAQVVEAYEKLYLGLLRPYEISYQSPTGTVLPSEIKLEIFGSAGHGASVFHPLALAGVTSMAS
ncbi:MAG TPA: hypothetical protein VHA11_04915, partial [Bryobacteraceae bacterium]|nr:hypothetical protein [Bryobacteraceae bacterium]